MREPKANGQNLTKLIANLCVTAFVLSVIIFAITATKYQAPDAWHQSARSLTKFFTETGEATFTDDIFKHGEESKSRDSAGMTEKIIEVYEQQMQSLGIMAQPSGCDGELRVVNCSDPRVMLAIKIFNLKKYKSIMFLEYLNPVNGSAENECEVAWRFRKQGERSIRKYRDYRRFTFEYGKNCSYKVVHSSGWHSGLNAKRSYWNSFNRTISQFGNAQSEKSIRIDKANDTIPKRGSKVNFSEGRYLYYSRGGDYCKGMNQYYWSVLCALGEAMYLNRTFVMDLNVCFSTSHSQSKKDEKGKDFRNYFDYEHLKEVADIVDQRKFLEDWKKWNQSNERIVSVKKVDGYKTTPKTLRRDSSTIIWRHFDGPESETYWYRVCEGKPETYIKRPWHALWKAKRLVNIVMEIIKRMDWDFDAVHVVRGYKAQNNKLWPHLDDDTSPDAILAKLQGIIHPWRNVYIATNEPSYHYFDQLRSEYKVHLLDDYQDLWNEKSEWYIETARLNNGHPLDFDSDMRVAVDYEILHRAETRVETFNDLTNDCKDGIYACNF